jgi:hypothetical protein
MLKIFERISNFFTLEHKTDLDLYIKSRNPKDASEVEHLIKEYTYKQMRGWV